MSWPLAANGDLAGRPIKLKLYAKNVKLFGFQFVE
jgi:hypothetical protein